MYPMPYTRHPPIERGHQKEERWPSKAKKHDKAPTTSWISLDETLGDFSKRISCIIMSRSGGSEYPTEATPGGGRGGLRPPASASGSSRVKTYGNVEHRIFQILAYECCTNKVDSYGDALRHPEKAVYDNFPEKSASVGEAKMCNALKTRDLLSLSFPKKCLLGRVSCFLCSPTVVLLP